MTDFARQRDNLVDNYVAPVVSDKRVVEAVRKVPREKFVPQDQVDDAYADYPLPIGEGQTISQPSLVAQMTAALNPKPADKVLEIGTGSGYQAAILGELVDGVYTIERIESLAKSARSTLEELGYDNVYIKIGDGSQGWPENAPYNGIIVTAAAPSIPRPLIDQLREGGRLVIPIGETKIIQELQVGVKKDGELKIESRVPVRFVPLIGEYGWGTS